MTVKKWNDRECNMVEWVISYISEMSVEEKHRSGIRELREMPFSQYTRYTVSQREALRAAITYFEDFYTYSVKGYPKGNKAAKDVMRRLAYLKSAREKLTKSLEADFVIL